MTHEPTTTQGFTVVELIVVIVLSAGFILSISQLITFVNLRAADATNFGIASNLAYNNLRRYANGTKPLWFDCIGDTVSETTPPFSDGKAKPNATGQVLLNQTSTVRIEQLPPPVVQKVFAIAPYGCGETIKGMPIRVQSEVTYGSPGRTVVHATFVSY